MRTSGTGTRRGQYLARADRAWLAKLITRCEPPEDSPRPWNGSPRGHQGGDSILQGLTMTDPSGESQSDRSCPWQVFLSELIGTALLVGIGLSIVIFMFGEGTPMAGLIPSESLRRLDHGIPLRYNRGFDRSFARGKAKRGSHQPDRHHGLSPDGQARLVHNVLVHRRPTPWRDPRIVTAAGLGSHGAKHLFWSDLAGRRLFTRNSPAGRGDHHLHHGFAVVRLPCVSRNPSIYTRVVSPALCRNGMSRSPNLRYEYQSRAKSRAVGHFRPVERLVDLLGGPDPRKSCGMPGLQLSCQTNNRGKVVSFR